MSSAEIGSDDCAEGAAIDAATTTVASHFFMVDSSITAP
jgi:hypothetical protein